MPISLLHFKSIKALAEPLLPMMKLDLEQMLAINPPVSPLAHLPLKTSELLGVTCRESVLGVTSYQGSKSSLPTTMYQKDQLQHLSKS